MTKDQLRKVVYTKWDSEDVDRNGYLHKFGDVFDDDKGGIITVAIIEDSTTGLVEITGPNNVRFVDDWE